MTSGHHGCWRWSRSYFFGGAVIRDFAFALIWGIVIGTYSSVFVAVPLLLFMNLRRTSVKDQAPESDAEVAAKLEQG